MQPSLGSFFQLLLLVGAAVIGLSACGETEASSVTTLEDAPPVVVDFIQITSVEDAPGIRVSGRTAYKREASLGFGSPGEILSIQVDEGDQVRQGQLLATLRRLNVGADVAESELTRKTAQSNYDRLKQLHESGAVSDSTLEEAQLRLERTRQTLQLTAPRNGVVLKRAVERGQIVSSGSPVVIVGEAQGGLIARASLNANQVARIAVGDDVGILVRERGEYIGHVSRISPTSSAIGLFPVEFNFSDDVKLRSGEVAEITIRGQGTDEKPIARYVIPAIALVDARADQGVIYIATDDGHAERVPVRTGGLGSDGVVILSGIEPGDRVITRGASLLRDGQAIRLNSDDGQD